MCACLCWQHEQLERDLQQVVDEKEELVTERDVYRLKYDRLNKELQLILKGDEKRVLDVDALIMENRSGQSAFTYYYYYYFLKPTSTKPQAGKQYKIMVSAADNSHTYYYYYYYY